MCKKDSEYQMLDIRCFNNSHASAAEAPCFFIFKGIRSGARADRADRLAEV